MTFINQPISAPPPFTQYLNSEWVNQTLSSLSLDEKIAQCIHVASWSNRGESHTTEILNLITDYGIGGVIFFQGDPVSQAKMTNRFQAAAKVPMMISIDGEWGLAMRLDKTVQFPYQIAMGAIEDIQLIYEMGAEMGRHCRRLGIHVNYAPTVDINLHPDNPVIGFRSFGSFPDEVSQRAYAYMKGMQDQGVLAVAKHFPGHGDTNQDSHFTLPTLNKSKQSLDKVELVPFKKLINWGVGGVMTGHLRVPELDPNLNHGATLSKAIAEDLLQKEMGFQGMVFTDALDMKGVTEFYSPAEINTLAFLAGNDALLFCTDVKGSIRGIRKAIDRGNISKKEIERRCRKTLAAKQWMGLNQLRPIDLNHLEEDLNTPEAHSLNVQLAQASITLYKGKPFTDSHQEKTATLAVHAVKDPAKANDPLSHHGFQRLEEMNAESRAITLFQEELSGHLYTDHFSIGSHPSEAEIEDIARQLAEYKHIIVSLHDMQIKAVHGFGITAEMISLINRLGKITESTLVIFGSPYALRKFSTQSFDRIVLAYQESEFTQKAAGRAITGLESFPGKLPVSL
ncbi:MAG: glycoside hydrolase family 3 [Bacteroidetes bacterium]|nr:glycoside hydrolase family 3 [Bacteroidota bacterium]